MDACSLHVSDAFLYLPLQNPHRDLLNYVKEQDSIEQLTEMQGTMRAYREYIGTLIVHQASAMDNGTYACTATSNQGPGNTTTQVMVLGKMLIVAQNLVLITIKFDL